MLREVVDFDWGSTPAGPMQGWPETLKNITRTALIATIPMTLLMGRNGILLYNDTVREIFGEQYDLSLGKSVMEVLPDSAGFYRDLIDACYRGEARNYSNEPLKIRRNSREETAWFNLEFLPVLDETGTAHGVLVISFETTDIVRAAHKRELIAQELDHRIKNIFTLVNSLILLSARTVPQVREFSERLTRRIMALSDAHDLIRMEAGACLSKPATCSLVELIRAILKPYDEDGARIRIDGLDVVIGGEATTALALVFHELATNAAKYGALASAKGTIDLYLRPTGDHLRILWQEHTDSRCEGPSGRAGFGSKLLMQSVEKQLGGRYQTHWKQDGLAVEIDLPRSKLVKT